jgi:ubiquinone/menaquinone biosynthesis C-methylase UbiE
MAARLTFPRSHQPELLDGEEFDPAELAANLRDIRRVNRLLGGAGIVLRHLPELLGGVDADRPLELLDLATGSADIPLAIAAWAKRRGIQVRIVASDASPPVLAEAQRHAGGRPEIVLARHDARASGLPDRSFDVVLCSLALHHFEPDDALRVLAEMRRLARAGIIVNDLRRSRMGFVAAWLAARLTTRNRLTRNDAPLSVRRAYTPAELRDLLGRADIRNARITAHRWFRMAAVARVDGDG